MHLSFSMLGAIDKKKGTRHLARSSHGVVSGLNAGAVRFRPM